MKQAFQKVLHKVMPPSAPASIHPCQIVVLQQWLLELIVAVPRMLEVISDLNTSDVEEKIVADLKHTLGFAHGIVPTYLRILKAWSNTLCNSDIHDLGIALSVEEYTFVNKKSTQSLQLITEYHDSHHVLREWSLGPERNGPLISDYTKHIIKAYETVKSVVAWFGELQRALANKNDMLALASELKHKRGVKVFQYFWQTCMDTLHELKVVSTAWDNVHLGLFSWGCGLFEGPMALDLFLQWPENVVRVDVAGNIADAFCEILFFGERELLLLIKDDKWRFKRDILTDVHKRALSALRRDEMFVPLTAYWNMMTFPIVAAGWECSIPMQPETVTPLECIVKAMRRLERILYILITERPRLLALRQARAAQSTALTASSSLPAVVAESGNSTRAPTVPAAIAERSKGNETLEDNLPTALSSC